MRGVVKEKMTGCNFGGPGYVHITCSIDRMPGQAVEYDLLPLYEEDVNCQLHFFADAKGIIRKREKAGCE